MAVNKKVRAASISVGSNTLLICFKVVVGILSGSVSILSEALHSGIDLLAALIAMLAVKLSSVPADQEHPYGHGKIENLSGLVEGVLILVAAIYIIFSAARKILTPHPIQAADAAIAVMLFSAAANLFVSRYLYRVSKAEDSVALEADALHLRTDVYTSAGVAAGLLCIKLTGLEVLDPVIAMVVALLIIRQSWGLCRKAFSPLLDTRLPDEEMDIISSILERHQSEDFQFSELRTRKSGSDRFIDFHAKVSPYLPISIADRMNRHLQEEIMKDIPNVHIHVHLEAMEGKYGTPRLKF